MTPWASVRPATCSNDQYRRGRADPIEATLPHRSPSFFHLAMVMALALASLQYASAQVQVDITLKRTLYIAYEPLIVNVSITNLSGTTLELADSGKIHWFGFKLKHSIIVPSPHAQEEPATPQSRLNPAKESLAPSILLRFTRSPNMEAIVSRLQFTQPHLANILIPPLNVEITEGRVVYEKTVGVPQTETNTASIRHISLLTHRLPNSSQLYIRIQDPKKGAVFCTHRLGRLVSSGVPDILLDSKNQPHILQNVAPRSFFIL